MRILLIFIDGLGIGKKNPLKNPCAHKKITIFNNFLSENFPKSILFNGLVKPISAQLDVPGLPQSATGQTALYTGINAAKILGKHLSGFPNQKLRSILEHHSVLYQLTQAGRKVAFINTYRPIFFEKGPEALIRFLSVTSIMNWKANLKFSTLKDLKAKRSIYHDFTNQELIKKGFNVPLFSAVNAGRILAETSQNYDFCLYEYFKTDHAGHSQSLKSAVLMLAQIEQFILTVLKHINLAETLLIITSDHGNIEDLSLKTHTTNPVPLMAWGVGNHDFLEAIDSILDITPQIIRLLSYD